MNMKIIVIATVAILAYTIYGAVSNTANTISEHNAQIERALNGQF